MGKIYLPLTQSGKHINFWVSKEDQTKVEYLMKTLDLSQSDVIRFLIQEYPIQDESFDYDIP